MLHGSVEIFQEQEQKLALPSIEEQAAIKDRPLNVDTWTYKPDNSLMYYPEGKHSVR